MYHVFKKYEIFAHYISVYLKPQTWDSHSCQLIIQCIEETNHHMLHNQQQCPVYLSVHYYFVQNEQTHCYMM